LAVISVVGSSSGAHLPEMAQGLVVDLGDALAGDAEFVAESLIGHSVAIASFDDPSCPPVERRERTIEPVLSLAASRIGHKSREDSLSGRVGPRRVSGAESINSAGLGVVAVLTGVVAIAGVAAEAVVGCQRLDPGALLGEDPAVGDRCVADHRRQVGPPVLHAIKPLLTEESNELTEDALQNLIDTISSGGVPEDMGSDPTQVESVIAIQRSRCRWRILVEPERRRRGR